MPLTGEQKREYQRKWLAKRRQDWIDAQGALCANCGSSEQLEVDHIDRSTKSCNPTAIWSRSQAFRDKELIKCQVLCESCHMLKTRTEIPEWTGISQHGTESKYSHGCHCPECKAGHAAYSRMVRARKKNT